MMTVKIAKVPGTVKEVALNDGATVAEALALYAEETGQETAGYEIRINDTVVQPTATLADGQKVYLVQQVKGN